MNTLQHLLERGRDSIRTIAPYALTALALPGGTFIAGALWLAGLRKSQRVSP